MILVTCCCESWMIVVVRARHVLVMLLRIDFYCWTQQQGGNKSNTAVNYVVLSLWTVYDTAQTPGTFQAACFLEQPTRKWKIRHVPCQTNKVKWIHTHTRCWFKENASFWEIARNLQQNSSLRHLFGTLQDKANRAYSVQSWQTFSLIPPSKSQLMEFWPNQK